MFDNRYYKLLLDRNMKWEIFDAMIDDPLPGERFQWRGSKEGEIVSSPGFQPIVIVYL